MAEDDATKCSKPLVKEAKCKCPHCQTDLVFDVVDECVTAPVKAVYERKVQVHVDPQGTLGLGDDD